MEQYVIRGGNPLVGEIEIGGAKNAALAILATAVMTDETLIIENLPDVRDINVLIKAMESIGVIVEHLDRHTVKIKVDFRYCSIHNVIIGLSLIITLILKDIFIKILQKIEFCKNNLTRPHKTFKI